MRIPVVALLVALQAPTLFGQAAEFSVNFGQSIIRNNRLTAKDVLDTDQYFLDDGFRIGFRMNLNTSTFFGHEFGYGYNRTKIGYQPADGSGTQQIKTTTHQGFYSFLLHALPEGSTIRPFVAGGGGFTTFYPPGSSVSYGNGVTKFGYNYGAGVKIKVTPIWGFRVDVRDYSVPKPFDFPGASGWIHQIEASVGLSFLL